MELGKHYQPHNSFLKHEQFGFLKHPRVLDEIVSHYQPQFIDEGNEL